MPGIFFALISYFGWGTGDIFATIATRKIGSYSTTVWYSIIVAILYIPLTFFFVDSLQNLSLSIFILNIFLGLVAKIGIISFYEALKIANASLVGTISASFVAIVVIFSIVFLNERINNNQIFAIAIIFLGVIISISDYSILKNIKSLANKGILLAVITMFAWGTYHSFIKIPISKIGWFWPEVISAYTFPSVLIYMRLRNIKLKLPGYKGATLPVVANALILVAAEFSYNFAISKNLVSLVAPIAGSYPTLFVILAFIFFKDKITKQQITGIVITLICIVLLSILSS